MTQFMDMLGGFSISCGKQRDSLEDIVGVRRLGIFNKKSYGVVDSPAEMMSPNKSMLIAVERSIHDWEVRAETKC